MTNHVARTLCQTAVEEALAALTEIQAELTRLRRLRPAAVDWKDAETSARLRDALRRVLEEEQEKQRA